MGKRKNRQQRKETHTQQVINKEETQQYEEAKDEQSIDQ